MESKDKRQIEEFFSQFRMIRFKKKEVILRADDEPHGVYYIKSGYVKMNSIFESGKELTLNIFKPGTYFPMLWAIGDLKNSYFFHAMTEIETYRAPKEKVLEFLKNDPEALFKFTRRLVSGLDGLLTNMQYLLSGSAYTRVVAAVLLSARRFGEIKAKGKIDILLPLTHQDIADLAGLTRETASLEMEKLTRKKIVTYTGRKVTVCCLDDLEKEASIYKEKIIGLQAM